MVKIKIKNKEGETLSGELNKVKKPKGLFILCHGFFGSKDNPFFDNLIPELKSLNFDVFRFDFSGNGNSEGVFGKAGPLKEKQDLLSVIEHFKDYDNILLLGHSMGGSVVITVNNEVKRVKGVVAVNPVVFYSITLTDSFLKFHPTVLLNNMGVDELKEKVEMYKSKSEDGVTDEILENTNELLDKVTNRFVLTHSFFEQCKSVDVTDEIEKSNKPILLIHGRFDKIIPVSHADYLNNQSSKVKLVKLNYYHNPFSSKESSKVVQEIKKWMDEHFTKKGF